MASRIWDTTTKIRVMAESLNTFLYEDGKPSSKNCEHTNEEYRMMLERMRQVLWKEYDDLKEEVGLR
ncbi:hypothetical protein ACI2JA_03730 [Alkalihalobacillus sp. NPDC078783]